MALQSNNNKLNFEKTAEMLDEDLYWNIIHTSLTKSSDQGEQEQNLISQLQTLSPIEIVGFKLRTYKLLYDIYSSDMWCAGYIMNEGCSDDGFEYFRCWVISRGKEVYYKAQSNPDNLFFELDEEMEDYEFEGFQYVANDAFNANTGKDIYDFMDDDFPFRESEKQIEFTWKEEDPESLQAICPKLFEAKGN